MYDLLGNMKALCVIVKTCCTNRDNVCVSTYDIFWLKNAKLNILRLKQK